MTVFFFFLLVFLPTKWAVCFYPVQPSCRPQPVKLSELTDLLIIRCHTVPTRRSKITNLSKLVEACFSQGLILFFRLFLPLCFCSGTFRGKPPLHCPVQTFARYVGHQAYHQALVAVGCLLRERAWWKNAACHSVMFVSRSPKQVNGASARSLTHFYYYCGVKHLCAFGWMMTTFVWLWMEHSDRRVELAVTLPTLAVRADLRQLPLLP